MGVTRMGKAIIFLADDDEGARRTLRTSFEGLPGYQVVGEARDGMGMVEGCQAPVLDAVLLDIQTPLLNGVSVVGQVPADRVAKYAIISTAFSDREYTERVQACGATGYLTKPSEAKKILSTIELCIACSKEYYLLNKEHQYLNRRCQSWEPINQAKLLLMETRGMREEEAYQYIRELSRRKGMSMTRVANYLLAQQEERHDQRHADVLSEIHGSYGHGGLLPGTLWHPAPRPGQRRAGGCPYRLPDRQRALYHRDL